MLITILPGIRAGFLGEAGGGWSPGMTPPFPPKPETAQKWQRGGIRMLGQGFQCATWCVARRRGHSRGHAWGSVP